MSTSNNGANNIEDKENEDEGSQAIECAVESHSDNEGYDDDPDYADEDVGLRCIGRLRRRVVDHF